MTIGGIFFMMYEVAFFVFIIVFIKKVSRGIKNGNQNQRRRTNRYTVTSGDMSANPDKYKTINSHYSPQTLNGVNGNAGNTVNQPNNDHQHAYEHKVEPIEEATVIDMFEDRKEAYIEKKKQMKADLPKSSYSETQDKIKQSNSGMYREVQGEYGRNGDMSVATSPYEVSVNCKYCGAVNIVPASRNKAYKCYFCRQEIV